MYLWEIGYEDDRWLELAQDHVMALISSVLNLRVLLPHSYWVHSNT
jgi:hypothetical protein